MGTPSKVHNLLLIRNGIKLKRLAMEDDVPFIWVRLTDYRLVAGDLYRQFSSNDQRSLAFEQQQLEVILALLLNLGCAAGSGCDDVCVLGDTNLDMAKVQDCKYARQKMLQRWLHTSFRRSALDPIWVDLAFLWLLWRRRPHLPT